MNETELSTPYWDGARRGELVVQRCNDCGVLRHYPRILCDACYSFEWSPTEIERRGELYSWTVSEHAFDPSLADEVPYVLATVTMTAGVRVLGRLAGADDIRAGTAGDLRPGMAVDLHFENTGTEHPTPVFAPVPG